MADFTQIFITADIEQRRLITDSGGPLGGDRVPNFYREEQVVLCFTCVNQDLSASGFSGTPSFEFGADVDYDQSTPTAILSENDMVNIEGDWEDADPAEGKLSVRVNTNTDRFNTIMDELEQRDESARCYLKLIRSEGNTTLFDHACNFYNIIRTDGSTPPGVEEPDYLTAEQTRLLVDDAKRLALATGQ